MTRLSACPGDLAARWTAQGGLAPEAARAFLEAQAHHGLVHGRRPLCPVLSPLVLSRRLYQRVQDAAGTILEAVERVVSRALVDPGLARTLGIGAREQALHAAEAGLALGGAPALPPAVVIGRMDMVFTERPSRQADRAGAQDPGAGDRFAFLELNAESPAGIVDQAAIEATLFRLPALQSWLAETRRMPTDAPAALLRALRACHAQRARAERANPLLRSGSGPGGVRAPRVAIVDWRGGDTSAEQEWLRAHFCAEGVPTCLADPADLGYQGGQLLAHGAPVDLVYRRVIGRELLARAGDDHPLLRALRDDAVCVVNPLRSAIADRKAVFAVLSDPAWGHLFTARQRAAIRRHVPWSRVLGAGDPAATEEQVRQRQEQLVIKPNDGYGGKGVVLGWTVTPEAWRTAVARGRAEGAVVQERVHCRRLSFPAFDDEPGAGGLRWRELGFDCDPFLFLGRVEGAMVRVSASPLSNVSAGGGVTGMLVVDDDPPGPTERAGRV